MYKSIIIGCGKIAGFYDQNLNGRVYSHAHAYSLHEKIKVTDYVDIVISKAEKLASKYKSNNFSDNYLESIRLNRADIVSVCTPDETHFKIVSDILNNDVVPRVIFIEKPVCSNIAELTYLKSRAGERKVMVVVNQSRRFDLRYKTLRDMILEGKFGALIRGDVFYYGGWKHIAVHVIDTLRFLFEDELVINNVQHNIDTHGNDPSLSAVFSFSSAKSTIYLHPFDENYYQIFDFDLKFDRSRLRIENFEEKFILQKKVINSMNENILVEDLINIDNQCISPMENAINILVEFLETENHTTIADYTLDKIESTMKVLWEGEKIATESK